MPDRCFPFQLGGSFVWKSSTNSVTSWYHLGEQRLMFQRRRKTCLYASDIERRYEYFNSCGQGRWVVLHAHVPFWLDPF